MDARQAAPALSIIIVNWNTRELLADCLRSVYATLEGLSGEVFVVDNASSDGSATMVRERFPQACLVQNGRNLGYARANNQALDRCRGRYALLLNSDTLVEPGAFQALVAFMDANEHAGACGPRLLNHDGTLQPSCHPLLTTSREFWRLVLLDRVWPLASYRMARWPVDEPREVEVIKGACLLLRRSALAAVGLLDERYFIYTEEMDLCYRLAQAGWSLWWVPQSRVVHYGASSTSQLADEMYLQLYRSKGQFQEKFWGRRGLRRFVWAIKIAYAPRWLVAVLFGLWSPAWQRRAQLYARMLHERFGA